jgi:hypothetical protein
MKTLVLEFEEYPGETVVTQLSPVPTKVYLRIVEKLTKLTTNEKAMRSLFDDFTPYLKSWTFEEPTDAEGLLAIDFNLSIAIVNQWATGVRSAPLPLLRASSDGTPSEAQAE